MACFMACHACHAQTQPLPLLSRAILQLSCNRTQLVSISQVSFHLSTHSHLISTVGHNELGKRQAADNMMGWDQGVCIAA